MSETRDDVIELAIVSATRSAVFLFEQEFNRLPDERELQILAAACARHILAPNAPSTRTH